MISSCFLVGLYRLFCIDYRKRKPRLMLQLSHQPGFFHIKGVLKKVFHVDIQHSDYRIELKNPAAVSSEAIIIGFGNSSCRSR